MAAKKKKRLQAPVVQPSRRGTTKAPQGPTRRALAREAQQARDRRDTRRARLATAAVVALLVSGVGGFVALDRRGDAELRAALTSGTCTTDERSDPTAVAGDNHVPAPVFRVDPPAGGNHLAAAARGGTYAGPSVPEDGLLVHSLEHGYVVLWHRPGLPAADLARLTALEDDEEGDVIVAERTGLSTSVAATAWGQRLLCEQVEPAALARFVDEYVGDGPEDVPRG